MNAREAREKTIWLMLPEQIKEAIEWGIENHKRSCVVSDEFIEGNLFKNKDLLEELGYIVDRFKDRWNIRW